MTFDPRQYWRDHGREIARSASGHDQGHAEALLRRTLKRLDRPASILEIGPGQGRITRILREFFPKAAYVGVEIGLLQAAAVKAIWPEGHVIVSAVQDWDMLEGAELFDLVVTSEVLMHIPPDELPDVIAKLISAARRYLLLLEWMPLSWELGIPVDQINWPHDYLSYLPDGAHVTRTGRQGLFLVDVVEARREYL